VANWPALELWKGPSGIQHLTQLAGDVPVEIMVSSAKNFRGDMESLILLQDKFSAFLNGFLISSRKEEGNASSSDGNKNKKNSTSVMQFYLAQCPISVMEPFSAEQTPGPLSALLQDITIPLPLIEGKVLHYNQRVNLSQINLWANIHSPATSSLHYDPYHNLLCVVTGQKIVRLVPPCATELLHNVAPSYAESANHADDDLFNPQRRKKIDGNSNGQLLEFILNPGDALFLPEGWWHQVASTAGTIAVNFWWGSREINDSTTKEEFDLMWVYYSRQQDRLLLDEKKQDLLAALCKQAYEQYPVKFYDDSFETPNMETPLNKQEKLYMLQLKQIIEAFRSKFQPAIENSNTPAEVIDIRILGLLCAGALPFIRILKELKKEHPGMVAVLLMETDSPKMWEALTTGLERRVSEDYVDREKTLSSLEKTWVDKAGGVETVLSQFYDDLYSDVGCNRKKITARMLKLKDQFAKDAFEAPLDSSRLGPSNELPVDSSSA
jgi:Cupin-like domain